jgi:Uma2 family endonuclease
MRVDDALRRAVAGRASVRVHLPLLAGAKSAPEPDVALVSGGVADYDVRHPDSALLVVEIADSSLPQDRLTKSRIYAHAGIPEYWIVNLRSRCVEVSCDPDSEHRVYRTISTKMPGDLIELAALPGAFVAVSDLLQRY